MHVFQFPRALWRVGCALPHAAYALLARRLHDAALARFQRSLPAGDDCGVAVECGVGLLVPAPLAQHPCEEGVQPLDPHAE